jgi:hypothetical protein
MVGRQRPAAGGGLILGDRQAQGHAGTFDVVTYLYEYCENEQPAIEFPNDSIKKTHHYIKHMLIGQKGREKRQAAPATPLTMPSSSRNNSNFFAIITQQGLVLLTKS